MVSNLVDAGRSSEMVRNGTRPSRATSARASRKLPEARQSVAPKKMRAARAVSARTPNASLRLDHADQVTLSTLSTILERKAGFQVILSMVPVARLAKRAALLAMALVVAVVSQSAPFERASPAQIREIQVYIHATWDKLTMSNARLEEAAEDPKFPPPAGGRWPVYLARSENFGAVEESLRREVSANDLKKIVLRQLPVNAGGIQEQGLLYLPFSYVVPGGRFREMYGWDSYFIQVGLLRDDRVELARDMAANFLY